MITAFENQKQNIIIEIIFKLMKKGNNKKKLFIGTLTHFVITQLQAQVFELQGFSKTDKVFIYSFPQHIFFHQYWKL